MSLPKPLLGAVIRYRYLWADDAASGAEEGDKDRPATIILNLDTPGTNATRVYVLPITHAAPLRGTEAVEIPAAVRRAAGLDSARAWVVLSEFNEFVWPGYDLGIVPKRTPPGVVYGFVTPGFFATLRDRWLALYAAGGSKGVTRDA